MAEPTLTEAMVELSKRVYDLTEQLKVTPANGAGIPHAASMAGAGAVMEATKANQSGTGSLRQVADTVKGAAAAAVAGVVGSVVGSRSGPSGGTRGGSGGVPTDVPPVEAPPGSEGPSGGSPTDVPQTDTPTGPGSSEGNTTRPETPPSETADGSASKVPPGTSPMGMSQTVVMSHPWSTPYTFNREGGSGSVVNQMGNALAAHLSSNMAHSVVQDGNGNFNVTNRAGQTLSSHTTQEAAFQALQSGVPGIHQGQSSRAAHVGLSALSSVGERGILGGALGGLAETVGMANPIVDAVAGIPAAIIGGGEFMASQRQANAQYQAIYGGSNMAGLGQRASELGFRISHFGDLTGAQANQLFMGVSQTGIQGSQRTNALNMATNLYNGQGVPLQESITAIQTAVSSGNTALTGLADAISSVGKAAKDAGINATTAYQQFNEIYKTTVASGVTGAAASTLAAGTVAAGASLGRMGQGVAPAVSKAMATAQNQQIMASNLGMSSEQLLALSPQAQATAEHHLLAQRLLDTSGTNQSALAQIAKQVTAAGGNPQDMVQQVVQQANKAGAIAGGSTAAIQALVQSLGMNLTTQQAETLVAGLALNRANSSVGFNMGTATAALTGPTKATSGGAKIDASSLRYLEIPSMNRPQTITPTQAADFKKRGVALPEGYMVSAPLDKAQKGALTEAEQSLGVKGGLNAISSLNRDPTSIPKMEYLQGITAQGKSDPILAKFLKSNTYQHQDYTVDVGNGKTAVVNTDQLVAHFADQVQSGQAKIQSGAKKGQSVAEAMQMDANGAKVTTNLSPAQLKKFGINPKSEKFDAANAARQDKKAHDINNKIPVAGKYIIDLSPSAKKYFLATPVQNFSQNSTQNNLTPGPQYPNQWAGQS